MTLFLSTLAVAFAALCVWLTVRIVNRRERWAKWTLAGAIGNSTTDCQIIESRLTAETPRLIRVA